MHFQITRRPTFANDGEIVPLFGWRLEDSKGGIRATGGATFEDEGDARADVAEFKKSMSRVRYFKVKSPKDRTT